MVIQYLFNNIRRTMIKYMKFEIINHNLNKSPCRHGKYMKIPALFVIFTIKKFHISIKLCQSYPINNTF